MTKPQRLLKLNPYPKTNLMLPKQQLKKGLFFFLVLTFFTVPYQAISQVITSGNLRNYNAVLTAEDNQFLVGRNRANLFFERDLVSGSAYINTQLINDYTKSGNEIIFDLREAYVDLYLGDWDVRVGKQIFSQGRTNGVFITDILSPLDLSEGLTLSNDIIKLGIPALKATRYVGDNYIEAVITPTFQSHTLPSTDSRWFVNTRVEGQGFNLVYSDLDTPALASALGGNPAEINQVLQNGDNTNEFTQNLFQASIRYAFRSSLTWNLDVFGMWWSEPAPTYYKSFLTDPQTQTPTFVLTEEYLQRLILAYSGDLLLTPSVILTSEAAFHFNRNVDYLPQDLQGVNLTALPPQQQLQLAQVLQQNGDGFLLQRPWAIAMIGLDYSLGSWNISNQLYAEHIVDHNPDILQEEWFYYTTLLGTRTFFRDKLTTRLFGQWNITGSDGWVNPDVGYELMDGVEAGIGVHLFTGNDPGDLYGHFSFREYRNNSFGYTRITAYF
ncbi:MAG: hypothetical protein AAFW89_12835 [Bacteroidota bacterium]